MSRKRALSLWMLTLMVLLLAVAAFAQNTASIKGSVTDATGAAVVGAKVTVKGPTGSERTTQTSSAGDVQRRSPNERFSAAVGQGRGAGGQ